MSEFENNLWLDVLSEHGDALARGGRSPRKHRPVTPALLLTGGAVGLAAVASAALLVVSASTSSPAFAVTRNANGTITVDLMKLSGIAHANGRLAAMGVPAHITVSAKSPPQLVCPGGAAPTITFDPARIPHRSVLVINPDQLSGQAALLKASTSDGNTTVHLIPASSVGGKIRTPSMTVQFRCP
jgi:hypothetical protein